MNDMTMALKAAGVPVPTRLERIWTLLKEQGPMDYKQVQRALNIAEGSASSTLNDLVVRDMVTMEKRPIVPGDKRTRAVYTAKGRVYALLPRRDSKHVKKFVAAKQAALVKPEPAPVEPAKEWTAESHVDALTLKQAREVFDYLKGVFG